MTWNIILRFISAGKESLAVPNLLCGKLFAENQLREWERLPIFIVENL